MSEQTISLPASAKAIGELCDLFYNFGRQQAAAAAKRPANVLIVRIPEGAPSRYQEYHCVAARRSAPAIIESLNALGDGYVYRQEELRSY